MSLSKRFLLNADDERLAYSVPEVAASLGVGKTTIYKLIGEGGLRVVKLGKRTLIPANDVHCLLAKPIGSNVERSPVDDALRS